MAIDLLLPLWQRRLIKSGHAMNQHFATTTLKGTPTTAPTQFVVICDFKNLGRGIVNDPEDTRATVIDMIATGEWTNVESVSELLPAEEPGKPGIWNDVTEDIAREVRDTRWNEHQGEVSHNLANWIQGKLGVAATHGMRIGD